MNYQIIKDEKLLVEFIDWLPELQPHEKFYFQCLARRKYLEDKSLMKSDVISLKRGLSDKKYLLRKIRQLEIKIDAYEDNGLPIPTEALALYININPRDMVKAASNTLIELAKKITAPYDGYNNVSIALSEAQKACTTRKYFGIDYDGVSVEEWRPQIEKNINADCLIYLKTRGGFHLLIELAKIEKQYTKSWYNELNKAVYADVRGDMLSPVPGCVQGCYVPNLITYD
jgi:hypothetical protein